MFVTSWQNTEKTLSIGNNNDKRATRNFEVVLSEISPPLLPWVIYSRKMELSDDINVEMTNKKSVALLRVHAAVLLGSLSCPMEFLEWIFKEYPKQVSAYDKSHWSPTTRRKSTDPTKHRMKRLTLAGSLLAILLIAAFLDVFLHQKMSLPPNKKETPLVRFPSF